MEIRVLLNLELTDIVRIARGYISNSRYAVVHTDTETHASIGLRLTALSLPYIKKYVVDGETVTRYNAVLDDGFSLGAYDGDVLVGILISEVHRWNQSLWVHEFHVAETHRNLSIGRELMACVSKKAVDAGLRIVVCETQNTNVPAIDVYRRLGFGIDGIDISYYSNDDSPDAEIAIFMKRRLT